MATGTQRTIRLNLVSVLTRETGGAATLEQYFQLFCAALADVLPFDLAYLAAPEGEWSGTIRLACKYPGGAPATSTDHPGRNDFPGADTHMQAVVQKGRAAALASIKELSHTDLRYFHSLGAKSCLQVPLTVQGQVGGVLNILGRREGQFSYADAAMVHGTALPLAWSLRLWQLQEALHRVTRQLEQSERTDWLTGLYNRKHFLQAAEQELSRAARYRQRVSLLFMDLDRFRDINNRFGHSGGDIALRHVSAVLRNTSRTFDILGRYGGEEFAIMLPHSDRKGALSAALRICSAIRERQVQVSPDQGITLCASIGSATYPVDGKTLEALMQRADKAMYQAKRNGGNGAAPASSPD